MALQTPATPTLDPQAAVKKPVPGVQPTEGTMMYGAGAVNATAPTAPQTPPATSTFGPQSNLIGTQFNATPSDRLSQTGGLTQNAANTYATSTYGTPTPVNTSGALGQLGQANTLAQSQSAPGYNPVAGTDFSKTNQFLGAAAGQVNQPALGGAAGPGQQGSFTYGADTGAARGTISQQLTNTLNNTPDRMKLAQDSYNLLQDQYQPRYEQDLRAVGQKAAALGRVGSGLTTNDLTGVQQAKDNYFSQQARGLATDAAQQSLSDQINKLNAAQGATQTLGGLDTAAGGLNLGYQNSNNADRQASFDRQRAAGNDAFGRNMDLANVYGQQAQVGRNDALTERGAQTDAARYGNDILDRKAGAARQYGLDQYGIGADQYGRERQATQDQFGRNQSIFGDLANYEQGLYGQEQSARNEMRGERGYQQGLDQQAQQDRIAQQAAEFGQQNQNFQNSATMLGAGGYDPSSVYGQQAAGYGQQAQDAYVGAGDLFSQWAQSRAGQSGPAPVPQPMSWGGNLDISNQIPDTTVPWNYRPRTQ